MKLGLKLLMGLVLCAGCTKFGVNPDPTKSSSPEKSAENIEKGPSTDSKDSKSGETTKTVDDLLPKIPKDLNDCKVDPNEKENVDFVYLDKKDIKETAQYVMSAFGQDAGNALQPYIPEDRPKIVSTAFNGAVGNGQSEFAVRFSNCKQFDFKNVNLQQNKEGNGGNGDYRLLAICVGNDCNKVFANVYIHNNESKETVYNWPMIFKKVGDKYLPARENPNLKPEPETDQPVIIPPQMKVEQQLEENFYKNSDKIFKFITEGMKNTSAVYSGLYFSNLTTNGVETDFTVDSNQLKFTVFGSYFPGAQKQPFKFEGLAPLSKETTATANGETFKIAPIDGTNLFLLAFYRSNFTGIIPQFKTAMSVTACSALVENKTTYHTCFLVSSSDVASYVLGDKITALEVAPNGLIAVSDKEIIDANKVKQSKAQKPDPTPKINPETGEPYKL